MSQESIVFILKGSHRRCVGRWSAQHIRGSMVYDSCVCACFPLNKRLVFTRCSALNAAKCCNLQHFGACSSKILVFMNCMLCPWIRTTCELRYTATYDILIWWGFKDAFLCTCEWFSQGATESWHEAAGLGFPPAIYRPLMSAVGKVPKMGTACWWNSPLPHVKLLVKSFNPLVWLDEV